MAEKITRISLAEEMQSSYLDYAMSVIIGRAIPEVRDGLKPVQRRILYAMYKINNTHSQPTKKSARIVGEIIGKYHPHGDMAVYDALARMAQDFSMNYMFVEGQGNFGSIDGDPPAAMRYTEVRLTKIGEQMLADLDKGTVEFIPNFDNTEEEPVILSTKIPNLLINGASGIAVGVATNIPPHNLNEVCDALIHKLEHEAATNDELMTIVKGPDFPTGGIAIMSERSYNGYRHGRGQVSVRANTEIDEEKNRIIVDAIPYGIRKTTLIESIVSLVKNKRVTGISNIRDESDKEGVRIVIELKRGEDAQQILNVLFKHTHMQMTVPITNLAVLGKNLRTFSIATYLQTFIDYRRDIIRKRCGFELNVAKNRVHIIDGLLVCIDNIQDIVKLIKESSNLGAAREGLVNTYQLTEKQANSILDMKLSRLTHLEFESLSGEKTSLEAKITELSGILADPLRVDNIIKDETLQLKKEYGKERRTVIIHSEDVGEIENEDLIANDKVSVIFTNKGYVKRMGVDNYREQARGGKGIIAINLTEGDYVKQIVMCNAKDYLLCISDKGRIYWLKAYNIPEYGRYAEGKAIVNLLSLQDEKIIMLLNITDFENSNMLFLTKRGLIKKIYAKLFSKPRSSGVRAITLNDGDEVVDVSLYTTEPFVSIATTNGKAIYFKEEDIRFTGRGSMGVRGIRLAPGDSATNVITNTGEGYLFTVSELGYGKLTEIGKYRLQHRGGGGVLNMKITPKTGSVAKVLFVKDQTSALLINSMGVAINFPLDGVRITGRMASGVRLMRLDDSKIVDAIAVDNSEEEQ